MLIFTEERPGIGLGYAIRASETQAMTHRPAIIEPVFSSNQAT